jgi:carbamoyl-phosphate synthase large subunit
LRVLVTGAGSGVGQAIAKALRISALDVDIVFADIDVLNPGFYRIPGSVVIPKVEAPGSLEKILDIISSNSIDAVKVGSVFDMMFFAENRELIERETGAMVIVSPPETIAMGTDKWLTAEYLREHNLPYPKSILVDDVEQAMAEALEIGFPLIVKPRFGRASQGVHVISDPDKLRHALSLVDEPIVQKMISPPRAELSAEYTCSFLKLSSGAVVGPFTARRSLRSGHSWVVEVGFFAELHPCLNQIARATPCYGPFNIQLMVGPNGPVPFEFNPRFSGTTAMRAHFGFNEPEMILRAEHLGEEVDTPEYKTGMAFRYLEEVFVDGATPQSLGALAPFGVVRDWF